MVVDLRSQAWKDFDSHELRLLQAILRHEDVRTTQRSYIKTPSRIVTDAMAKLEAKIGPRGTLVEQIGASNVVN